MKLLLLSLALICSVISASAAQMRTGVLLRWDDPNPPEVRVVMYNVFGKSPLEGVWIRLGNTTTNRFQMDNLRPGVWHFSVTCVSAVGLESEKSEPSIAYRVDPPPVTPQAPGKPWADVTTTTDPVRRAIPAVTLEDVVVDGEHVIEQPITEEIIKNHIRVDGPEPAQEERPDDTEQKTDSDPADEGAEKL